ncbi:MAG TPA: alcohol dehydrogenase catalytic domain-containing protein [Planctomicrobium sp.]|nr:alcohol dehydrogenase catalytic domain-containing protein [Planctomicrobium sp.]
MQAVQLTKSGLVYRDDFLPSPVPGQIPVQVLTAGICETDLQLVQGYMGFQGVLGHEFVGIAEEGKYAGQRVAGEINCACRACDTCRSGFPTHCPHRTVLGILNHDGAFADRLWLPEENLHPLPDSISNEEAVFVEPVAAAFQILEQVDLQKFRDIVILGEGRLGNLSAQVLASTGADLFVIGKHSEKLERLKHRGIRTSLLSEQTTGRIADLVVDCTGSATGFADACRFVRPRGTIVLKTTVAGQSGPNLAPVVIDEINVVGSRCGPFPPAIAALASKTVEVESLISGRFPLSQAVMAFEQAKRKDQLKILFEISPSS